MTTRSLRSTRTWTTSWRRPRSCSRLRKKRQACACWRSFSNSTRTRATTYPLWLLVVADPVAGAGDGGPEARVWDGARGLPGHHPPAGAAERASQRDHREGASANSVSTEHWVPSQSPVWPVFRSRARSAVWFARRFCVCVQIHPCVWGSSNYVSLERVKAQARWDEESQRVRRSTVLSSLSIYPWVLECKQTPHARMTTRACAVVLVLVHVHSQVAFTRACALLLLQWMLPELVNERAAPLPGPPGRFTNHTNGARPRPSATRAALEFF